MKHERNEDKNDFLLFLLPEIFTVIAGSTAVYAMGIFGKQLSGENALRNAVMTADKIQEENSLSLTFK